MRWNWQRPDWPKFQFEKSRLREAETQFLKGSGVVVGAMQHLDKDANQQLEGSKNPLVLSFSV